MIVWIAVAIVLTSAGEVNVASSEVVYKTEDACKTFVATTDKTIRETEWVVGYGLSCAPVDVKQVERPVKPSFPVIRLPNQLDAKVLQH